jgi:putative sugar O-methyltransferase
MALEVSELWKSLSNKLFANIDDEFIATFRQPGGANSRLATWDPFDKTMRYFKFMLYTEAERQPDRFFEHYRALGKVDIGQPVSMKLRGCDINIDYLFALEEFLFLESFIDPVKSVVEIGAGFGRTCHTLLTLADRIESYTIVDLPDVLNLSRRVLSEVALDRFHKVRFVDATDLAAWQNLSADLAINIDSFQEMPPATIDAYMRGLIARSRYFYVKNPVGKYRPESIGIAVEDPAKFKDVFSLGYCRDVIDIFDDMALAKARKEYLQAYCPPSWQVVAERPMSMFPYLHHALYRSS